MSKTSWFELIFNFTKRENDHKNQIKDLNIINEDNERKKNELNLSISRLNNELASKNSLIDNLLLETKELKLQQTHLNESIADFDRKELKKVELTTKLLNIQLSNKDDNELVDLIRVIILIWSRKYF